MKVNSISKTIHEKIQRKVIHYQEEMKKKEKIKKAYKQAEDINLYNRKLGVVYLIEKARIGKNIDRKA